MTDKSSHKSTPSSQIDLDKILKLKEINDNKGFKDDEEVIFNNYDVVNKNNYDVNHTGDVVNKNNNADSESNTSSSHSYYKRDELLYMEPWSSRREELVNAWRDHVDAMSKLHEEAGYRIKKRHTKIGLITNIIPLIMTFLQIVFEALQQKEKNSTTFTIINGAMWLISSILSLMYSFLSLGTEYALHFQYSARYYDLLIRIDSELSRKRRFRKTADVFVTELRCQIDNLNKTGPDMPIDYCFW